MKGRVGGGEEEEGDQGDGKVARGKGEGEAEFADSGMGGGLSRSERGGSRADSSRPVLEEGGGEEGEELRGVLGAVGGEGGDGKVGGGGGHALEGGGRERQTRETRNQVLPASAHTDAHTDTRLALVGGRLGGSRLEGVCVGSKRQEERWDVGGMVLNLLARYLLYCYFIGTKVQTLTQKALLGRSRGVGKADSLHFLALLALLVQNYKY
jgi:hypothetical protein